MLKLCEAKSKGRQWWFYKHIAIIIVPPSIFSLYLSEGSQECNLGGLPDDNLAFTSFQGYQFWTRADENGYFAINNVHAGDYNLYAWVPGFIGDYRFDDFMKITPGVTSLKCSQWIYTSSFLQSASAYSKL